jgi:hypothetical protein
MIVGSSMQRLHDDIRQCRWLLLTLPLMFLVLRWWYLRGRPERIGDLRGGYGRMIYAGNVYWFDARTPGALVVRSRSLSGGEPVEVGRDVAHGAEFRPVAVTRTGIYYLVERLGPVPREKLSSLRFASGPWLLSVRQGMFEPAEFPVMWHARLRRMPLRGGAVKEYPWPVDRMDTGQSERRRRAAVLHDRIYWVCDRPAGTISRLYSGPQPRLIVGARADLLSAPVEGGEPVCLARDLQPRGSVLASTQAVLLVVPRDAPDLRADIYRCAGAGPPTVMRGFLGTFPLVDLEGRLYWVQETSIMPLRQDIMSMRPDGSDRRVHLRIDPDQTVGPVGRLATDGRYLYFVRTEPSKNGGLRHAFCRLDPRSADRVQLITYLPGGHSPMTFDGQAAYFTEIEERDGWLDWTATGLNMNYVPVLYRIRLPS